MRTVKNMKVTQKDNLTKYCIDCNKELTVDINWSKYNNKHGKYICQSCITKRNKKRHAKLSDVETEMHNKKKRNYNKEHWKDIKFRKDTHKIVTYFICSNGKMCCELCGEDDIDIRN